MSTYNRSIGQRSVIMDKLFLHSASVVVRPKTVRTILPVSEVFDSAAGVAVLIKTVWCKDHITD